MNQFFRERFQAAPGGDDLEKDFRTVAVLVDHSFDGVELADDLAHPDDRRAAFFFGMPLDEFPGHGARLRTIVRFVKKELDMMGYGGMRLIE